MNKKLTILYVVTQGGPWGGAQKYVYDLATAFSHEYNVIVAIGEPNGDRVLQEKLESEIRNQKSEILRIVQLKHLRRAISPWYDLLAIGELRQLYKKVRPDIVHLNSSKSSIIGSLAKLFIDHCSLIIVATVHGWASNEPRRLKKLYAALESLSARLLDRLIVLSPQDEMIGKNKLRIPAEKLVVIPHGIDLPTVALTKNEARRRLSFIIYHLSPITNAIWIGAIANFYSSKGLDILIRAFEKTNIPDHAHLVILGDGPKRGRLEEIRKASPAYERIHFLGFVPDAEQYLPAFDLLVIPSRKEGLPFVLLAAMAAGVPVIATAVGGIPTYIENKKTGYLVPPEDPKALADALPDAMQHPETAKHLADAAKARIAPYTKSRMVSDTAAMYRMVCPKPEVKSY